ncbi:MAG TPA: hypothetical protein VJU16_03580, partial [Planctomycetota bacterium]|nr:hypothetical protein [Planctomycetota bacterium]
MRVQLGSSNSLPAMDGLWQIQQTRPRLRFQVRDSLHRNTWSGLKTASRIMSRAPGPRRTCSPLS